MVARAAVTHNRSAAEAASISTQAASTAAQATAAASLGQRKLVATGLAALRHLRLDALANQALHRQLRRVGRLKVDEAVAWWWKVEVEFFS